MILNRKSTCDNSDVSEALYAIRNTEPEHLSSWTFQTVYCASDTLKARLCEDPKYVRYEQAGVRRFQLVSRILSEGTGG